MRTLILALVLATLTGCAAFQTRDPQTGKPTGNIDQDKVQAAQTIAQTTGVLFGPYGVVIGTGIASVIGGLAAAWQRKQGENKGYAEGHLDATGKALPSEGGAVPRPAV